MKTCPHCFSTQPTETPTCPRCGFSFPSPSHAAPQKRSRNRLLFGFIAFLFGTFGIHHFAQGHFVAGFLSLALSWTGLSTILGMIQGIRYFCLTDQQFDEISSR